MPMNKKAVFLFLLIILPIAIFLFLKSFGRNEFTIPVYYEQGLGDSLSTPCLNKAKTQYFVSNNLLPDNKVKVVHFERMDGPLLKLRMEELERVQDVFYNDEDIALMTFVNSASLPLEAINDYQSRIRFMDAFWNRSVLDSTNWAKLKFCDMAMTRIDNRVVLVDKQNKIRGYYNITEREETDRLILELRILKTEIEE